MIINLECMSLPCSCFCVCLMIINLYARPSLTGDPAPHDLYSLQRCHRQFFSGCEARHPSPGLSQIHATLLPVVWVLGPIPGEHYRSAKTWLCCTQKVDELAEIAMTAHHQQGEHDKAVEAARLIRSIFRREAKLRIHGYWKELADLTQVSELYIHTQSCPANLCLSGASWPSLWLKPGCMLRCSAPFCS